MRIVSRALNFNRSLKEMQVCVLTKMSRIILPIREHLHIKFNKYIDYRQLDCISSLSNAELLIHVTAFDILAY